MPRCPGSASRPRQLPVALPADGSFNAPRTMTPPLTSSLDEGLVLPIPILPVDPGTILKQQGAAQGVAVGRPQGKEVYRAAAGQVGRDASGVGSSRARRSGAVLEPRSAQESGGRQSPKVCASAAFRA